MLTGSINLLAFCKAEYLTVNGKPCVVIPVQENPTIFVGTKGIYAGINVVETKNNKFGFTHFVGSNITNSEERNKLSNDERKTLCPILGNLKEIRRDAQAPQATEPTYKAPATLTPSNAEADDFPL